MNVPIRYLIDKKRKLVISYVFDCLTFAEILAHESQLASDPDFDPAFHQLIDATAQTDLKMSIDEAKISTGRKLFSPASRRALVTPSPAIYGMVRMLLTYHRIAKVPSLITVFYDMPLALAWLGIDKTFELPKPA
jgi:hypothetical protein